MKSNIVYQNYGTSILLFITGQTTEDAHDTWLSLFNWGATSTEPKNVAPNTISCWSTLRKFQRYLFNIQEHRFWNNKPSKCEGLMDHAVQAQAAAKAEFESIATESFRSINSDFEPMAMGEISAEEPDDDFMDAVVKHAFANR